MKKKLIGVMLTQVLALGILVSGGDCAGASPDSFPESLSNNVVGGL